MSASPETSLILSLIISVLIFSGMKLYTPWLIASSLRTVLGGYFGSLMFVMLLTAIGNFQSLAFGKTVQVKLFPEVLIALLFALLGSALIHRVCVTTCFIFSSIQLYYVNRYSQKVYTVSAPVQSTVGSKKKNK